MNMASLTSFLDIPDHPNLLQIEEYLHSYCKHFGLNDRIKLGYEAKSIKRTEDDSAWIVETVDQNGRIQREVFDRVAIANGQVNRPHLPPSIEGLKNFKGQILHSQAYKRLSILPFLQESRKVNPKL